MSDESVCFHCDEPIGADDFEWATVIGADGRAERRARHDVCAFRSAIGGLNHLLGRCTCCGGTEPPDPPGLSRYDAAKAAVAYYLLFPPKDAIDGR